MRNTDKSDLATGKKYVAESAIFFDILTLDDV